MLRDKSAKMAKWLFFCQIAILALLSLCIDFKNSFCQMTSFWVLWKTYFWLLLKTCLWPCPGLSMYLSDRINWIISSFPHRISKILLILGSWDDFRSLRCRIGECSFFCCLTTWKKHCAYLLKSWHLQWIGWTGNTRICISSTLQIGKITCMFRINAACPMKFVPSALSFFKPFGLRSMKLHGYRSVWATHRFYNTFSWGI